METPEYDYLDSDAKSLQEDISNELVYGVGKDPLTATHSDWLTALSTTVRARLIERWMETHRRYYRDDVKRLYYFSMEFLIGRTLTNSLLNLGIKGACEKALRSMGLELEQLRELEHDAALGNGGLGRLAACILDSLATLDLPGTGYGIRYEYGMFRQEIRDGEQAELPENWLDRGNPWEFPRAEVAYSVRFGGHVVVGAHHEGAASFHWLGGEEVLAQAYDTPVPGFGTSTVNNLRLWSAKATRGFDLQCFNQGNYIKAVEGKTLSENLSKVLYPADNTVENQKLRLKQQYFFVSASLQDILRRFLKQHDDVTKLPEKVGIQLNDTHPAIAIPELMRILLDQHKIPWQPAWEITTGIFSYTNHTLLPEALETWPAELLGQLLPRHLQLIYEINRRFLLQVGNRFPGDTDILRRLSIIGEAGGKHVRMAHLAIVGSHKVNGVSALHSRLLQEHTFRDFETMLPGRIVNVTNGITPRRWLNQANPRLADLIDEGIGPGWMRRLDRLAELKDLADDPGFAARFAKVKRANKADFAAKMQALHGFEMDPDSLFDAQIKRIHEYKRQLMNLMRVVALYNRLRENPGADMVPRSVLFAGKAAPGYYLAKQIIRLTHDIAGVINNDAGINGRLRVFFIPDYNVSTAADIIPAAELSQQISTAGMEASGTGNMKLALNGALTMGTLDGANIEIRDQVGADNIFTFGLEAHQVQALRQRGYRPRDYYEGDAELRGVIDEIRGGYFSVEEPDRYKPLIDSLLNDDHFMVMADFRAFMQADARADLTYRDQQAWNRRAILNTAMMGFFSSDRTVRDYAEKIWNLEPIHWD